MECGAGFPLLRLKLVEERRRQLDCRTPKEAVVKNLFCWCVGRRQIDCCVFGGIYFLPIAANDALANLRWSFTFAGLLVGIEGFFHADVATGTMAAYEAIEQAAMTLAAVAVAKTRLLIEDFLAAARDGVSVEDADVGEERWLHGGRKRGRRWLRVESRCWLVGIAAMLHARHVLRSGCGELGDDQKSTGGSQQNGCKKKLALNLHGASFSSTLLSLYSTADVGQIPLACRIRQEPRDQGMRNFPMRTASSLVMSRTRSPFKLSSWLFTMK